MAENDALRPAGRQCAGQGGAVLIGQVAALRTDAALQRPGVRPVHEPVQVMVGLDQGRPTAGEMPEHLLGDAAGVGAYPHPALRPLQDISYAAGCVVGRRKSGDGQPSQGKRRFRVDRLQPSRQFRRHAAQLPVGEAGGEDRHGVVFRQHFQGADVVGVAVGDHHRVQVVHAQAVGIQSRSDPAQGDPRVHQHAGPAALYQRTVAAGAAGEGDQSHPGFSRPSRRGPARPRCRYRRPAPAACLQSPDSPARCRRYPPRRSCPRRRVRR